MKAPPPEVIWPAPGYPALLEEGQDELRIVTAHHRWEEVDFAHRFANISLVAVDGARTIPLRLLEFQSDLNGNLPDTVRDYAALPEATDLVFSECLFGLPAGLRPEFPRRSQVFDLRDDEHCLRPHSVALTCFSDQRISLAFASDLHLAALWELVIGEIQIHAPELLARIVNPRVQWERFAEEVNELWRRGDLDIIVLGGDLVDHVLTEDRFCSNRDDEIETNVHHFLESLSRLMLPVFVIPGNHDHRLFPWRPRVYGLGAIGLSREDTHNFLRRSSLGVGGGIRFSDLRSIQTRDEWGRSALRQHLRILAPALDYAVNVSGMCLIFSSTGSDALVQWSSLWRQYPIQFLRSLATAWKTPDSEGFSGRQIQRIRDELSRAKGAALFFHSPMLNPSNSSPLMGLELNDHPMEAEWQRAGLRDGVSFSGSSQLIRELLAISIPVVTFSGHIHRASRIDIHKDGKQMTLKNVEASVDPSMPIQLLTGPALGQVGSDGSVATGYLLAHFDSGKLTQIESRKISPF